MQGDCFKKDGCVGWQREGLRAVSENLWGGVGGFEEVDYWGIETESLELGGS
jgi:hypothetical protein